MATKKEVDDLQAEILRLNNIIQNLNQELSSESKAREDLANRVSDLSYWNSNLTDQLSRCNAARSTNEKLCANLMISVAYLGKELNTRDEVQAYHLCSPAVNIFQATASEASKKDLNNYFEANS